jgi:predicted transcriptional regulator
MATNSTKGNRKQVGLNIRAALYDDLTKIAKDNGQTTTYLLEQAVEHYLRYIAPSQDTIRPEMMAHARKSIEFNRKLLELLAK